MVTVGEVRPGTALVLGPITLAVVLAVLLPFRGDLDRAVPALGLVVPVLVAGIVGGRGPALACAVLSAIALNLFFLQPYGTFRVAVWEDVVALAAFSGVAASVGTLTQGVGRRQRALAARAAELEEMRHAIRAAADEREALQREALRLRELEATEDQRAAVLRSVSHDLRTPLATIRAIASDLRSGTDYDTATRNELLDIVGDEAERLDRLVANLLALSRLEAGAMTPLRQAVDLDELLRERARRLARLFHQVRLVVDVPDDLPLVDGDYSQLDQLVTNLLENASRYAPARSTVTVRAAALTGDPPRIRLEVEDEGVGVPDHERSRIFEPFRGADATRSSGVGLATCRGIVEAHGGRIWVDRTPGGGATFFVTLPVRKGRSGAA
jgi:K+-sensing histidine kinase KdpD